MSSTKINLIVSAIVAALTILLWSVLNQPSSEPVWPSTVQGFSFSPFQKGQSPLKDKYPSKAQIDADLSLLQGKTQNIRSYSVQGTLGDIPELASAHHLQVTLGAFLNGKTEHDVKELKKLILLAKTHWKTVKQIIVGNELLLDKTLTIPQLARYLDLVRRSVPSSVSVAEPWHIWLKHPELVERVDFIAVHLLPYWEGLPVDSAVDYVQQRYEELEAAYPGKRIVIGEVGWPSNGRQRGAAEATPSNQAQFLRRFLNLAERKGWEYFIIEAFDQPWKSKTEGGVGAYWGVYDVERHAKFSFSKPVVSVPNWRELSAISIVCAILVLLVLFRDGHALSSVGRGFLAIVTYAVATAAVWLIYEYSNQYMTWGSILLGIVMLIAIIGLILVLLAEAHEWAEALWQKEWRRPFKHEAIPDDELPFVSIHVPAYNEPPDMLNQTLDALAAMDYPKFEVLVIDNNTKDPKVWEPVKAHCKKLGTHFRFFHVDPLAGFKAGAMNVAMRATAPEAEVIAAIDSDYLVDPRWLRDLTPAFEDPKIAIVQAPQDYRDGGDNAFKAMCNAEYRGFFNIGMVTRNERDAIIQHGTMTMIRRRVLEEVGGWSEWCITEDAELGLRVFEAGYSARYIPCSYGQGLIPDNFLNFKKQRFRWAYGAIMIMRHHSRELFGLKPTALTRGQRYHFIAGWLPWISDSLNLIINAAALVWTTCMVVFPERFDPPLLMFAIFPLSMFVFKLLKLSFLYIKRVKATPRQSIGAAIAGLSLSHTISLAVLTGLFKSDIGFFRTPKMASHSAVLTALSHVREELLFMLALWLGAWAVRITQDSSSLDVNIWALMLLVQSIPYAAAVLMSLISANPRLPARLIGGTLGTMTDDVCRTDNKPQTTEP